ncbi:MAG: CvpA family protein [Oscillospiraceae bacterium]|nr:CvpA family protein [Oscillospiraceae bacterium]
MHIIANLLIIAILVFCAWQGYKRGVLGSILAVVFIIIAVYGGNLLANTYSNEFTTMFRPFISGYLTQMEVDAVETVAPANLQGLSTEDLFRIDPSLEPEVARQLFLELGVHESREEKLTDRYLDGRDAGETFNRSMTDTLVYAFCFLMVFVVAFLLILIGFTVAYNLIPFSLKFPGLKLVDGIAGGLAGLAQGFLLVFMLGWLLGYLGTLLPEELMENANILEFFVSRNHIGGFIDI